MTRRAVLTLVAAGALAAQMRRFTGQWAATVVGRQIAGTWTAEAGEEPDTGGGAWTLLDAAGRVPASGRWSARKGPDGWAGAWAALAGCQPALRSLDSLDGPINVTEFEC